MDLKNTNRGHRNNNPPNTNMATLPASAQIAQFQSTIENLNGGYNLRNWSFAARSALLPQTTITLQVTERNGQKANIQVPKLALLAASPQFQRHMKHRPQDTHIALIHQRLDADALRTIRSWLYSICTEPHFTRLPLEQDVEKMLALRLTAKIMGMAQYITHVTESYICGLGLRIPPPSELVTVVAFTRDRGVTDPALEALANRVAYLCTFHEVDADTESAYGEVLGDERFGRLLGAVKVEKVEAIRERGWMAVYRRVLAEYG
ncbi:hypothetical protein BDW02DRAFT_639333 [Decorospora gaudefroyi]|uniref:BTB domain-containing protein n=1 Tax=Decorospora gaudefroyi TaxID=184978 RepID=A0A6A5KG90_9PLEO|nr:hypothetical protein BDW02DRAFT_639333 [Decorospora gaudefroyi]